MTALFERTSLAELAQRQVRVLDVGMDLDGVAIWFDRQYVLGCQKLGLLPAGEYPPADVWHFYERLDHSLQQFLDNCDQLADRGLLWNGPVMAGAKTMWDTITDAGHRIHVKTDRAFGSHPAASEVATHIWLNAEGLRHESVTFTADKTEGTSTDIMLEDKLENYDALEDAGTRAFLIDRPWNQPGQADVNELTGLPRIRITTHEEFAGSVLLMGTQPADGGGPW